MDNRKKILKMENQQNYNFNLSDEQIELIANIFSKGNIYVLSDMDAEWLLSHGFLLGAKFYRDFINKNNGQ